MSEMIFTAKEVESLVQECAFKSVAKVLEKYRELSGDTNPNTPISRIGGFLNGYEMALEQTTWIPVSERLPDKCDYKSCYEVEDGAVFWTNEEGLVGMGYYYESTKTWSDIEDNPVSVTAWMPLPEPYKAESEE